jgi:hypothetical protein
MRRTFSTAAVIVAALALTGCSNPTSRLVYEGRQGDEDRLPDIVLSNGDGDTYDLDSSRFLGAAKGHEFYAVRQGNSDCVATIGEAPSDWMVSCVSGGGSMTFTGAGVSGQFAANGFSDSRLEDGWINVHPSLRIAE